MQQVLWGRNIQHLLINCPYSVEVWGRVGIIPTEVKDVINENLSLSELEVRAEIISSLVFRKKGDTPGGINTLNNVHLS
jgi:hypothetical protein